MQGRKHKTLNPIPRKKGVYLKMHNNDIGKKSIPQKDRCEGFDELWSMIYFQVLETWDWLPVTDLRPFGGTEVPNEDVTAS